MKIKPRSFPYPVLSSFTDDVVPNGFQVDLKVTPTKSFYALDYTLSLEHSGLEGLITGKQAALVIHVECQTNFYRKVFKKHDLRGIVRIPVGDITGRVEVSFLVVALHEEPSYRIDGIHEDYGNLSFNITSSDVLALLETKYFDAKKEPEVLKKISSIIQVALLGPGKTAWEIDLDGEKIYVRMPQKDMEMYHLLRSNSHILASLNSTIVIPALVEALHQIRNTAESELEVERKRRWFSVLERKLKHMNVDVKASGKSMFEIAQEIMEFPGPDTIDELDQLLVAGE